MTLKLMLAFNYMPLTRHSTKLFRPSKTSSNFMCDGCGVRLFSKNNSDNGQTYKKLINSFNKRTIQRTNMTKQYSKDTNSNVTVFISQDAKTLRNVSQTQKFQKSDIRRLLSLAKPERWRLAGAITLLIVSSAVTMSIPFSMGKVLDLIYAGSETVEMAQGRLQTACMLLGAIFLLGALCNFGRVYLISIAGQRMTQALRKKVFSSILNQEVAWFSKSPPGALLNRLSADTQQVSGALSQNVSDGLRSLFMVFAGTGMMFYMSPSLALVGVCVVPPLVGVVLLYGRFVRNISKLMQDGLADASAVAEERISNIKTVKTFSQESRECNLYDSKVDHVLGLGYRESFARAVFYGMTGFAGNTIILSVLYYGGVMISTQSLTIGELTSFLLYAAYIGISMGGLSSFYSEMNKGVGAATRLWEIIDRKPSIPVTGGLCPSTIPKGNILLDNVTFSYPKLDVAGVGEEVLKGLTLELVPGRSVALVGRSGCGKSTVAALLLRLYDPLIGKVLLDGVDIKDLDPQWLRSHIGYVSQEPILFDGSIEENILYGAGDTDQKLINNEPAWIRAARAAQLGDLINFREGKWVLKRGGSMDAESVGSRGGALSGGQRQRVAIARAIVNNPKILILDEATSALDAQSERLVSEALEEVAKGGNRTILTIAHRLSTIQRSDLVALMKDGRIEEMGSYKDLMQRDSSFKDLMKHQAFNEVGK